MVALLIYVAFLLGPATRPTPEPPERAEDYAAERIGGYEIRFDRALLAKEPELAARVRIHLAADLDEIDHLLPDAGRERLADVTIWVEIGGDGTRNGRGLCTHWSADWLRPRGFLVDKAGAIEIGCARDFVEWRRTQPYMLLHEFAHAYHWRLGEAFPAEVAAAFEAAKADGRYDVVAHTQNPAAAPAYAKNNVAEYFAELTEAYFGLNDFFPHTRPQLREHDANGLRAIQRAWRTDE